MSHFPHGAFIAIHAAREKQRKDQEEELEMTNYTPEDLENNWEFKIVRTQNAVFRNPQRFQQLLDEESIAGWELLEKIDDSRVRFKRPRDARRKDPTLPPGIDPYRTQVGSDAKRLLVVGLGMLLALMFGAGFLIFRLAGNSGGDFPWIAGANIIILVIAIMVGVVVAVAKRSR